MRRWSATTSSSHAAIALANARAFAERERLLSSAAVQAAQARERAAAEGHRRAIEAQEAERARIARELHDETDQVLTGLALHLRALEDELLDHAMRARLGQLRRQVNAAAASLRELATELRLARAPARADRARALDARRGGGRATRLRGRRGRLRGEDRRRRELVRAIRAVAAGERYLHPALGAALAAPAGRRAPVDELSAREREVLRMLALGHTNQEMRAGSRAEMVRHAIEAGLLDRPG